jgi:hypothetical protein
MFYHPKQLHINMPLFNRANIFINFFQLFNIIPNYL